MAATDVSYMAAWDPDFDMDVLKEQGLHYYLNDCWRIYQWLTWAEMIVYFGNNYWIAQTMVQDAPRSLIDGRVMFLVQVALY